jgi:hypothetical protein
MDEPVQVAPDPRRYSRRRLPYRNSSVRRPDPNPDENRDFTLSRVARLTG